MHNVYFEDELKKYLSANGFFSYRKQSEIGKGFLGEFNQTADPGNKRNLLMGKSWKEITGFGLERRVLVIDLGGTNLNMYDMEIDKKGEFTVHKTQSVDFYTDKIYTPEILFLDLKKEMDTFIPEENKRKELVHIVFIFSYPIEQFVREDGYIDAICTFLNKTRKHQGIIGMQVGISFEKFLQANGYPKVKIAVTNDAPIYCLAAKAYEITHQENFDAAMNIIVGTGSNISTAFDETDNGKPSLRIINTEFGDFKTVPLSKFDCLFDEISGMPGRYLNEKMISGAWIYQMFRTIISDMIKNGIIQREIFSGENIPFETMTAREIESIITKRAPAQAGMVIEYIWRELNKRGGTICGIAIASILGEICNRLGKEKCRILVMETGSVIFRGYRFREQMIDTIDNELIRLNLADKVEYKLASIENQAAAGAAIFDTFFQK